MTRGKAKKTKNKAATKTSATKTKQEQEETQEIVVHDPDVTKDFVFIPTGGLWYKFRQDSAWHSSRLARLAAQYQRADCKRSFIKRHVVYPVHRQGGRFLKGCNGVRGRKHWVVINNQDVIIKELMRILRQLGKRLSDRHEYMQNKMQTWVQHLDMVDNALSALRSTIKRVRDGKRSYGAVNQSIDTPALKKLRSSIQDMTAKVAEWGPIVQTSIHSVDEDNTDTEGEDGSGDDSEVIAEKVCSV